MSITTLPDASMFRTLPLRGLPEGGRVDRKVGMIYGAKAMQLGPLNLGDARPWKVDQTTLEQLSTLVNQRNAGAKMRFAHPNMSRDGMGRHLGRASNARIVTQGDETFVAVDSKLSEAAKRTPNGNLHDHVLDLAEETPEDFGLSVAPILDEEAMGKIEPDAAGLKPIRLKGLRAIDVVDEPAATKGGLFSLDSDSPVDLPAQATFMLDTFFGDATAEVIRGRFDDFLKTYLRSRGDDMATEQPAELATLKAENERLTKDLADARNESAKNATVKDDAKETAKAELTRRSEISALCQLAKVSDKDRDLMLDAGFSRAEAQDYLKSSGRLSMANPAISEGGNDPSEKKETPDDKFGAEYDKFPEVYEQQGTTREAYIKSRRIDEGLDKITLKLKTA